MIMELNKKLSVLESKSSRWLNRGLTRINQKKYYKNKTKEAYERFVKAIAEGRHLSEDEVKKLADGRTYTGTQAVANKLADKVGTEDELIDLIKEEKGLSNPTVIELRADKTAESLISRFVKATTKSFISELNSEVNSNKVERSYLGQGGDLNE